MFDTSLYTQKLSALRAYLFEQIDGLAGEGMPLADRLKGIEVAYEMGIINKPKEQERASGIFITEHAYDRAKERLSMNRTAFIKLSEKAFTDGMVHSEAAGNLKKYIDKLVLSYKKAASNIRIYGENVFLFSGDRLITVYQVPPNLKKSALKNQKSKKAA